MTDEQIISAAQGNPARFILHYAVGATGRSPLLVGFSDTDSGIEWFKLPDGTWAWVC
ncbi:MAG: hypothetical protein HYY01_01345 [Chloroflexi bacterium]|nr:hypothetical protein [Chloroflexota bacterium]